MGEQKGASMLQVYREMLDDSFRKHFPEWDALSSWDPIKLFAESLQGSLVAIEQRHQRLASTFVDSLPSLLGFENRPARLPAGQVALTPSPKQKDTALLARGTVLRFNGESGPIFARLESDVTLLPATDSVVDVEVFERTPELSLGTLRGEPWESIALPDAVIEPPTKLELRLPDEQTVELRLESQELLRIRHCDPNRFRGAFFYNGTRHELIVPAAAEITRGYQGGVTVRAFDVVVRPSVSQIPPGASFHNELPRLLAGAKAGKATREFVPRETAEQYLDRFYALVRAIPARSVTGFYPEEICREIPGLDPRVLRAEFAFDETRRETVFYVLLGDFQGQLTSDEQRDVLETIHTRIARRIPLDARYRVEPFYTSTLVCDADGASVSLLEKLQARVQPPPIGGLETGTELPVAVLERDLASAGDKLRLRCRQGSCGAFVSVIVRKPGERFELNLDSGRGRKHG